MPQILPETCRKRVSKLSKGRPTEMTQHAGLPVAGYQPQSDDRVQTVNTAKALEERVLRHLDTIMAHPDYDKRMIAIARTGIQEAFMWANRAVFQPARIDLPEDSK